MKICFQLHIFCHVLNKDIAIFTLKELKQQLLATRQLFFPIIPSNKEYQLPFVDGFYYFRKHRGHNTIQRKELLVASESSKYKAISLW